MQYLYVRVLVPGLLFITTVRVRRTQHTVATRTVQYLANCEGFIPLDRKIANDNRNLPDTEILVLFVKVKNSILSVSWQIAKDVRKLNRELGCGIAGICCAAFPICLVKVVTVICHFYISRKVIMSKPDVFLPKYNAIVIPFKAGAH